METDSIVLEHLRAIRRTTDKLALDMQEVKERLGILETQVGGLAQQYASLSVRIDRLDARVERIERRRDLVEG